MLLRRLQDRGRPVLRRPQRPSVQLHLRQRRQRRQPLQQRPVLRPGGPGRRAVRFARCRQRWSGVLGLRRRQRGPAFAHRARSRRAQRRLRPVGQHFDLRISQELPGFFEGNKVQDLARRPQRRQPDQQGLGPDRGSRLRQRPCPRRRGIRRRLRRRGHRGLHRGFERQVRVPLERRRQGRPPGPERPVALGRCSWACVTSSDP